ncbi:MAG: DUF1801 domain-containing protein [Brucellaceae bacterium]|nr:DUF1801 domain-containing protein [Brucellaceae bacterium]
MKTSAEVDAWMAAYENPQKPVVEAVRAAMLAADARLGETIKWQAPTFVYKGNLASFFPKAKKHATLMFHTGASLAAAGKFPSLEGDGETSRSMKFLDVDDVRTKTGELKAIVKAWCDAKDG